MAKHSVKNLELSNVSDLENKEFQNKNENESHAEIILTSEHMKMVQSLVYHVLRIKLEQEALSEDVKAVAQKMDLKPGEVKEMVTWIIQEQEKGGVLSAKEKKLEFARQVLSFLDEESAS